MKLSKDWDDFRHKLEVIHPPGRRRRRARWAPARRGAAGRRLGVGEEPRSPLGLCGYLRRFFNPRDDFAFASEPGRRRTARRALETVEKVATTGLWPRRTGRYERRGRDWCDGWRGGAVADVRGAGDYRSPYTWLGQVDVELPGGERFWHDVIRLHRAAAMVLVMRRLERSDVYASALRT